MMSLMMLDMRLSLSYDEEARLPSKGMIRTLINLSRKRVPLSSQDVIAVMGSESSARAFLVKAEREGLLIRGSWDTYYPVPAHVAMWSSLLLGYYQDLFRIHGALKRAKVPHAFACLTASALADYVSRSPIVAVPREHFPNLSGADVFGITLDVEGFKVNTESMGFKWSDGTFIMNVPTLSWPWTALLLGAIGLSREVAAAKEIITGREDELDDSMVRRLNSVGLSTRPEVFGKEFSVLMPKNMLELREKYAESLRLREVMKE